MSERPPSDVLGLGGTLPGPGWVVLDAARDQRFTGELITESDAVFRIYFDRGRIYVAERATDPPLGTRLVEAGALNPAQLDYGSLRIGDIDHLGRLFERVPSVNRDGVLVLNELMTEECVRALAGQTVRAVAVTPYRHHPSGMHRWNLLEPGPAPGTSTTVPIIELPAPHPGALPVDHEPPAHPTNESLAEPGSAQPRRVSVEDTDPDDRSRDRFDPTELFFDDVVAWNEPSAFARAETDAVTVAGARARQTDVLTDAPPDRWIDQLGYDGVAGAEAASAQNRLASLPIRPVETFEMVWPSGETVDVVDSPEPPDDVDHDRVGPTARVPTGAARQSSTATDDPSDSEALGHSEPDDSDDHAPADDVSPLAVRRAVATIDTGSLEARRRLVDVSSEATAPPGRLVVQRDSSIWRSANAAPTTSVFDELPVDATEPADQPDTSDDDHSGRSSALRRLITSLRRS